MAGKNRTNQLHLSRVYDAPVKMVWDAWTDEKQAAQWWGPRGFTITHHSKDLRPGGTWHYTMHGPDGTDYPNTTKYLEVEKHARLVYDHGGHEDRPALFRVTVTFKEIKGKTHMDMTMTLATAEAAAEMEKFIRKAGGYGTWDRLAEYLTKKQTDQEQFVIQRSFDVSLETMYEMWTDPKALSKWLPPTGFTMKILGGEIRPGAEIRYSMTDGKSVTMYGRITHLEMEKPNRLVSTQEFCDAQGNLSRHPLAPTWPATMLRTITLTAEGPERTRVKVTWEPHGNFNAEELATFVKARGNMTQGWTGSFDQLDVYLVERGLTERET